MPHRSLHAFHRTGRVEHSTSYPTDSPGPGSLSDRGGEESQVNIVWPIVGTVVGGLLGFGIHKLQALCTGGAGG